AASTKFHSAVSGGSRSRVPRIALIIFVNLVLCIRVYTLSSRPYAWRDLLFFFDYAATNQQQVPRLRRSSASRMIFFARDDRVVEVEIADTKSCLLNHFALC